MHCEPLISFGKHTECTRNETCYRNKIDAEALFKTLDRSSIGDTKTGFATECFWVNKALKTNDNTKQIRAQTHGSILTARVCAIRHVHVPDQRGLHSEPQDTTNIWVSALYTAATGILPSYVTVTLEPYMPMKC